MGYKGHPAIPVAKQPVVIRNQLFCDPLVKAETQQASVDFRPVSKEANSESGNGNSSTAVP